jgi:hypothetical protein
MDKFEYLKLSIKAKRYHRLAWWIKAFSLAKSDPKENLLPYDLTRKSDGYYFMSPNGLIKIRDNPNRPLFDFLDDVTIDSDWLDNNTEKLKTKIGNVLVNALLLADNFNDKISFMTGSIKIKDIEKKIAALLVDNPPEGKNPPNDKITINEYLKFINARTFLNGISQIAVVAATPKTLLPPPGLKKFRKELVKKYGDKLKDYKTVAEIESKLAEFDKEWLKDDPSFGKFLSGKVLNINRKKMYLTYGAESGFGDSDEANYIEGSLDDGWTKDPEKIVTMFNSIRSGSYSRGHETQEGGLVAKVVLRATGNFKIADRDCGTKLGIVFEVDDANVASLIGRYQIKSNNSLEQIENIEMAKKLLGKIIKLRSIQYCHEKGEQICKVCAGKRLSEHPKGIALAVTEVSAQILTSSLKKMHGGVLSVVELDLDDAFS